MGELESALDALDADDLFSFTPEGVLDRTAGLVSARNRIDAMLAGTVRHGDATQAAEHDGKASMASWLRGHYRLSNPAIGQLKRTGRVMEHLPAIAAAFAAGSITAEQVAVISPITSPENLGRAADQNIDLGEVDRVFAEIAQTQQHAALGRAVHHYLSCLDPDGPDGPEPDPTEGRSLSLFTHDDGRRSGRLELDPIGGEKVESVLESFVQAGRCAGDTRTRAQQLADALVQWKSWPTRGQSGHPFGTLWIHGRAAHPLQWGTSTGEGHACGCGRSDSARGSGTTRRCLSARARLGRSARRRRSGRGPGGGRAARASSGSADRLRRRNRVRG